MTDFVEIFDVFAFEYESNDASEQVYFPLRDALKDGSVWRTTNPEQTRWLIVVVSDKDSNAPGLDYGSGIPYELSDIEVQTFVARRLNRLAEASKQGKHVKEDNHYGFSKTINPDTGDIVDYDGPRSRRKT